MDCLWEDEDFTTTPDEDALMEDLFDPVYLEDIQATIKRISRKHTGPLINVDYNLNSPLLTERPDAVLRSLQGFVIEERLAQVPGVKHAITVLKTLDQNWDNVKATTDFHKWVADEVFQQDLQTNKFSDRLTSSLEKNGDAVQVLEAFWTHLTGDKHALPRDPLKTDWIKGRIDHPSLPRLLTDGEWFWFFHRMVLMLNSSTPEERTNLALSEADDLRWTVEERGESFLASSDHSPVGTVYIVPGYVFLKSKGRLLNRDMTLMIKDTLVARFASKMSLVNRADQQDGPEALLKLTAFYKAGDLLMSQMDNDVFDAIKLIEPHGLYQMSVIANKHRPLLPVDSSFRYHLASSLMSLEEEHGVDTAPLFDIIKEEASPRQVLLYYGSFRHWGHPFLDYQDGLEKLYSQVQMDKDIDVSYANALASDLAFMVLEKEFFTQRQWFVDIDQMDPQDPLRPHIQNQTWPTPLEIQSYGDRWHLLPLTPCYTVPQTIDPAVLYSDKSHSMTRSEVINHVRMYPNREIPSRKVLRTALETEQVNIKEFLSEVNERGLSRDDLVIGLKGKEREVKKEGRFFSLMSWKLRQYFVATEHLIKELYVPLFSGLTMADDLTKVTKKLLDSSLHQGKVDYSSICVANHVDYQKWNNHQRGAANNPVFRVMGQFLGLPELFVRTHEFFETSLVYYGPRPDLMEVQGDTMISKAEFPVCWEGQQGGLEGLRQKGWSIVNLLVLLREAKTRNTLVRTLAQGDNQVICNTYRLPQSTDQDETEQRIAEVIRNNEAIMTAVSAGTGKLGLLINRDETMQSTDFLSYGKVPVYRGNILPLEAKRWSRVTCVTNDQLPSLSNVLSTISTNAITIAQHSPSLLDPTVNYVFFGVMALCIIEYHDTLLQRGIDRDLATATDHQRRTFYLRALFLDPSVGGTSGTSLSRFLIRQFPDPVTESLSFWKAIHENSSNRYILSVALEAGHPRLGSISKENWMKLLERPSSLNIPKGLSAITLLRNEIRRSLEQNVDRVRNETFAQAIKYLHEHEHELVSFLETITPLFPRFLSEFKAGTFLGLTESLVGLFQNAKTIRNNFSHQFATRVAIMLRLSEEISVKALQGDHIPMPGRQLWSCSASHADTLREMSWGSPVVGTTVPHPLEYLNRVTDGTPPCTGCSAIGGMVDYVTVCYPQGFQDTSEIRGPLPAYLGSRTAESTSLFHPWEKESVVPLVDRAARLRTAINWFIEPSDPVAKSILNNLSALTGEDWSEEITSFTRTGSALHRFFCTRQSNGGFASISPTPLTHLVVTADTMTTLSEMNYDFMFQSSLVYAETVSVERNRRQEVPSIAHHFHLSCDCCIRPIYDVKLSSQHTYHPPDRSIIIRNMCGTPAFWNRSRAGLPLAEGNWDSLPVLPRSFHIGTSQGLMFGLLTVDRNPDANDGSLFPNVIGPKMSTRPYMLGILRGLYMAAAYNVAYHRSAQQLKRPKDLLEGSVLSLIHHLSRQPGFATMVTQTELMGELKNVAHRIPPSYPPSQSDISGLIINYFTHHVLDRTLREPKYRSVGKDLWIFADAKTPRLSGLSIISHRLYHLFQESRVEGKLKMELTEIKGLISYYCSRKLLSPMEESSLPEPDITLLRQLCSSVLWCTQEVRHAARSAPAPPISRRVPRSTQFAFQRWGPEYTGYTRMTSIDYSNIPSQVQHSVLIPKINDPLINGLRIGQLATGAHYKLRCLLNGFSHVRGFICGGDGSGGMTSALLRLYPTALGIFNSLMTLEGRSLRGTTPGPPSAVACMDQRYRFRCVNIATCWTEPSDLRDQKTWENFTRLKELYNMDIDLIVFDFEYRDYQSSVQIERLMAHYVPVLLSPQGRLIYKTYGTVIVETNARGLSRIGSLFRTVELGWTELSGSFTSELYMVCDSPLVRRLEGNFATTSSVTSALQHCCARRTLLQELSRACHLSPKHLISGISPELLPSPLIEITTLLITMGLSPSYADEVSEVLRIQMSQPLMIRPVCFAVLSLLSNAILDITPERSSEKYKPPSDQRLQRHLSFFLGVWLFLVWSTGEVTWYERVHQFLNGPITYLYEVIVTRGIRAARPSLKWDWSFEAGHPKTLQKPELLSLTSRVIRAFAAAFPERESRAGDWDFQCTHLDNILCRFNRNLTSRLLLSNTGIFYPMFGPKSGKWAAPIPITNTITEALESQVEEALRSRSALLGVEEADEAGAWMA
uniref:Replicase n=1 Tax=Lobos virus TaxID=3139875 RepID=A0AAN0LJ79_9VIRU